MKELLLIAWLQKSALAVLFLTGIGTKNAKTNKKPVAGPPYRTAEQNEKALANKFDSERLASCRECVVEETIQGWD